MVCLGLVIRRLPHNAAVEQAADAFQFHPGRGTRHHPAVMKGGWILGICACGAALLAISGCAGMTANKRTYAGRPSVEVHGARLMMQVRPEGEAGGSYMVSAMIASAGVATLDGPFSWRIEATGRAGVHEALVVHRLHTRTATTNRSEWYPADRLGRRALFRPVKREPGVVRARYEIPGLLQVKPREDGRLTVTADVSVKAGATWRRATVRFQLDPAEKRQSEFIFLPAEIVKGLGTDPEDWDDPMWD